MRFLILLLLSFSFSSTALAARPFLTDDATVVDDCQIESWWQKEGGDSSLWIMPACNVSGVELAAGAAKTASGESNIFALSAKAELKPLQINDYGVTAEVAYEFASGSSLRGDTHVNFALTKSHMDDNVLIHFNLGRLLRYEQSNDWTAGVALQLETLENHWVFVEGYREERGRPLYQVGYLTEILPERLQLDISYGNRLSTKGGQDLFTAGLAYYFKAF